MSGGHEDLIGVPETVVDRVDRRCRIVPRAAGILLHAAAGSTDDLTGVEKSAAALRRRLARGRGRDERVAARQQVADADIAGRVHRRARHPAMLAVSRAERALLVERPGSPRVAEFVPANTGATVANVHGMRGHHRLVSTEIPDLQAVHKPVGDRLQRRSAVRLRDTGFTRGTAEVAVEGRDRDRSNLVDTGVLGRPVDIDLPDIESAGCRHRGRKQRIRRPRTVEVAGNEAEFTGADVETDQRRRLAGIHGRLVHDAKVGAPEGEARAALAEQVGNHRDRVVDDAVLRVVVEADVIEREFVAIVAGGRIAALRNRNALRERVQAVRKRELAHEPAIGGLVIQHDRVALVVGLAVTADAAPDRVAREGPLKDVSLFVVHGRQQVDHLHEVIRANLTVRVRRCNQESEHAAVVIIRRAGETGSYRRGSGTGRFLQYGIG